MSDSTAESYRASHTDPAKPRAYDRGFWTPGTAKHLFFEIEREWVVDRIRELSVSTALDFACGTGRILSVLEQNVGAASGVDISEGMADMARERCSKSTVSVGDITSDGSLVATPVDLVTSFRFFLNAEDDLRRDVLRALRSRLKSGGALIANFHLNPHSLAGLHVRLSALGRTKKRRMLSLRAVEELLANEGFKVERVRGYGYLGPRRERLVFPWLQSKVETTLARLPLPAAVAENFLILARRT